MHSYEAFGMTIVSNVSIPFLKANKPVLEQDILTIEHREKIESEYRYVDFLGMKYNGDIRAYDTDNYTLICYENNIRICVSKQGNKIIIICSQDDLAEALIYCFTAGMVMTLYYRGCLVLHAAAFEYCKKGYALVGDSGVGKSTLLLSMLDKKATIISDDICSITPQLNVLPNKGLPCKLWRDSLSILDDVNYKSKKMLPDLEKLWIYFDEKNISNNMCIIDGIFLLEPYYDNVKTVITIEELSVLQIVEKLSANLHAFWCLPKEIKKRQIEFFSALKNSCKIVKISYPKRFEMLECLKQEIIQYIES